MAFALQTRGWWLRNTIFWSKTNLMSESVRDRLSTSYELLFLLTKSHWYYFDLDPIRSPLVGVRVGVASQVRPNAPNPPYLAGTFVFAPKLSLLDETSTVVAASADTADAGFVEQVWLIGLHERCG